MRKYRKKRIIRQAQVILFCSALIWMAATFISAIPAIASQPKNIPLSFSRYTVVANYKGYTFASGGPNGNATVTVEQDGTLKTLCELDKMPGGIELVQECEVPIGIARHLKVLSHKGMSHDIVVAHRYLHY